MKRRFLNFGLCLFCGVFLLYVTISGFRALSHAVFIDDFLRVHPGQTLAEVEEIMASHKELTGISLDQQENSKFFGKLVYEHRSSVAWVEFRDGRVVSTSNDLTGENHESN